MAEPIPLQAVLHTPRLRLRAAQPGDLDDFYSIFSNKEVMKYWSCAPHNSPEQTQNSLNNMIRSPTNGTVEFVIALDSSDLSSPETGEVIGKVGIWSAEKSEIGFMLNQDHWGKGYMAEALTVVLPHIWKQGVQEIVADVDPGNDGSMGILKKFAFVETGRECRTGEVGGMWYDSVYFALEGPKVENIDLQ